MIGSIAVGAGILVGFAFARLIGKYISGMHLPGAVPLILSGSVILAAALIASSFPAIRAARVDAIQALRAE